MKKNYDIVIVGAGAAGLLCAGLLASSASVIVFDKNNRIGKKLHATGNGRCNFTNLQMDTSHFYVEEKKWLDSLLKRYTPEKIIEQFGHLGVLSRQRDGYLYPHTNQASTLVDALISFCQKRGVEFVTEARVKAVYKDGADYVVNTTQGDVLSQYVVLATGGRAQEELGGSNFGYKLAKNLGHKINPLFPGLTGLKCAGDFWKNVAGTRVQGQFSYRIDHRFYSGEKGEIQIVKDGVSGIPVFQECRTIAKALSEDKLVEGIIDFVPQMNNLELSEWITLYGIDGLVQKKWIPVLSKKPALENVLKGFKFRILDTFGIDRAQVTAGGVPLSEVDAITMESKISKNIYLVGEILDVDGKCGGYNLHFAWSTANACARAIKEKVK